MRIISGKYGGQEITSPHSRKTRPMSEKLRNALFNTLGDLSGQTVLDAFSGSGALAFEAISRGAMHVTAIDNDRSSQRVIEQNIKSLGVGNQIKLIRASAGAWLNTTGDKFDVIICDPPYDKVPLNLLEQLAGRTVVHGIIVFSLPKGIELSLPQSFSLLSDKPYGDARLVYFRAS